MTDNRLTRKEALRLSVEHWEENYKLAMIGKLNGDDIHGDKCALCQRYHVECSIDGEDSELCPMVIAGYQCRSPYSPWEMVSDAIFEGKDASTYAAVMLTILRELYRKELEKEK